MSHIVQIDRARALRALPSQSSGGESFDVVVFLNHFLTNDGYDETLAADPDACMPEHSVQAPVQHMVMQSPRLRLCLSLGSAQG